MTERSVKVVILGESGVGKTSLVVRYVNKTYHPFLEPTIGAAFFGQTIELPDQSSVVHLKIWDTGGQERYHSLAPLYYRGSGAAIFVYDICRIHSFQTLKRWVRELEENDAEFSQRVIALVGNKSDLTDHRSVPRQDAELYAEEIGAYYVETSAKDDANVQLLFEELARRAALILPPDKTPNLDNRLPLSLSSDNGRSQSRGAGCCFGR